MNRSLASKYIHMVSKHMRRYSTSCAVNRLESCTLKQPWDITTDLIWCLIFKLLLVLVIENTDEDVNQMEHSLNTKQNTLEDSLAVSWETEHAVTTWSSNNTPWYFFQTNWGFKTIQKISQDIYSSFIHNCPNM